MIAWLRRFLDEHNDHGFLAFLLFIFSLGISVGITVGALLVYFRG